MTDTATLYGLAGVALAGLGIRAVLLQADLLRRIIALNILGAGVFLTLIATAYRGPNEPADPVPHALVLTGIVVAISATALALALGRRLHRDDQDGE